MPNIIITDRDLTTASSSINNSYAVFIPGITGWNKGITKATEFTSLAAFRSTIGDSAETFGTENNIDKSYVYACELLGIGLPVVYKVISGVAKQQTEIATDTFDDFVSGTSKLSFNPNGNTTPGTTNLAGTLNFYDTNGASITIPSGVTVTVDSSLVVVVSGGTFDPTTIASISYNYTTEIPAGGLNLSTASVTDICGKIADTDISEINDRGLFDVSFVTTGGYPTVYTVDNAQQSLISMITTVAAARGDCFAIIDVEDTVNINKTDDIPTAIVSTISADAFVVTPWVNYPTNYSNLAGANVLLPGSFDFLVSYATSIKTNNSWFATAGVRRGFAPITGVSNVITNSEADALQPDTGTSINAITYIRPYGYVIWGNRTLNANASGLVANSFINIRQLVHDIKRQLYTIARGLMFEPNDDILWVNFKNQITPLLERMRSGQGISSYRLVRVANNQRATLTAKIIITPIEAVENFELTVELTDDETVITE